MTQLEAAPGSGSDPARSGADAARRRRRELGWKAGKVAGVLAVSVVVIFPLYWMVVVALSSRSDLLGGVLRFIPHSLTLDNFRRVFSGYPVGTWFANSVAVSVVVALLTVTISMMSGYAFAQLEFRGSTFLFFLTLIALLLPLQVIMVPLFTLITRLHLYGTYWAVILPTSASAFGIFLARQFLLALPRELIEAARIDGAGHWRTFVRIVLPLSKPLLAVLFFMSLLQTWNDFAWPLIALKQNQLFTLPIGLLYLQGQFGSDYGATMAFALFDVTPMVLLFLFFQRYFVQGFARSGLR